MYSRNLVAIATATSLTLALTPAPQALAQEPVTATATASINTAAQSEQEKYQDALAAWEQDLAAAEQAVDDAEAAWIEAQEALDAQQERSDAAFADLEAAEQALEHAKEELAKLETGGLERAVQQAEEALAAAESAATDATQAAHDASAAVTEAENHLRTATQERDDFAEELAGIEEAVEEFTGDRDRIANELKDLQHREETGADYSVKDWKRLAAQSIEEMINQYRIAHGLHPLTVHPVFTEQAEAWSAVMARDYDWTGDLDSSFRHSNSKEWGRSGENIIFDYQSRRGEDVNAWTRQTWESVPYMFFDRWRHSSGHNRNMLAPQMQRMAVGIEVDSTGGIFGTTMFFIEDAETSTGYYSADAMTRKALESGEPFYLPAGATELMRAEPLTNPELNPDAEPDYGDYILDGLDKSVGVSTGLDPDVVPVDHSEDIQRKTEALEWANGVLQLVDQELPAKYEERDRLNHEYDAAKAAHDDAVAAQQRANSVEADANANVVSTQARLSQASDELARVQAIPREPYEQSLADATVTLNQAQKAHQDASATLVSRSEALEAAYADAQAARSALEKVREQKPEPPAPPAPPTPTKDVQPTEEVKPAETSTSAQTTPAETPADTPAETSTEAPSEPTTEKASDTNPTDPGSDGSSTAGTAIAVIVSLLAILAAGIAFAPQLGIDLSKLGF